MNSHFGSAVAGSDSFKIVVAGTEYVVCLLVVTWPPAVTLGPSASKPTDPLTVTLEVLLYEDSKVVAVDGSSNSRPSNPGVRGKSDDASTGASDWIAKVTPDCAHAIGDVVLDEIVVRAWVLNELHPVSVKSRMA